MKTKVPYFILLHISIMIYTFAGIASKFASRYETLSVPFCVCFGIEVIILGIYAVLWQQVISKFQLSIAYANKGATLIWSLIWALTIFKENITIPNIIGIVIVIVGIILVNSDSNELSES